MKANYRNILLLVFIVLIIYVNTLNNQFVWDDVYSIVENPYIKSWKFIPNIFTSDLYHTYHGKESIIYYRPLQSLSLVWDYFLWRLNPIGYHITNIFFHIFNVILVYLLTNLITKNKKISMLAGLFFAVHPVHTQGVTYISGRADLLATFFLLSSFLLFIKHINYPGLKRIYLYLGSVIFFVSALFSKETAIIFPFTLLIYGFVFHNRNLEIKPFFIIVLSYCMVRFADSGFTEKIGPRILTISRAVVEYLRLLVVPSGLHIERELTSITSPLEPVFLISTGLLCIIAVIIVKSYRYSRVVFFGLIWFFMNLVPLLLFNTLVAEHWLYLPSIGFFIALSIGISKIGGLKTGVLTALILATLSIATIKQNTYWKNELVFYERTLEFNPRSDKVRINLGILYMKEGRKKEAKDEFIEAIKLNPKNFVAYKCLGNLYFRNKSYDKAMNSYKKSLELNPRYSASYVNIGAVLYKKGLYDEAIEEFNKALEINPYDQNALNNLRVLQKSSELNPKK